MTMSTVRVTVQWGHTVETVPCLAQKDSTEKIVDTPVSVRMMADVMPKQVKTYCKYFPIPFVICTR